jgi:hypothetical protein
MLPNFNSYGTEIDNIEVVYPLNELVFLEEIIKNENGKIISTKDTDFRQNSISEKKYCYDNLGNLINEIWMTNNQKSFEIFYNYEENIIQSISFGNTKIYYKYNAESRIIEVSWFDLLFDYEVLYATTNFEYINGKCESIIFNASESRSIPYEELHFWTWKIEDINKFALDINYWLDSEYDYCYPKNYEIKIEYNCYNEVQQTTFRNITTDEIKETRFFIYEYNENIENNPKGYMFNKNHPLEYIAGFSIRNNQIEHLFSHKFEYFN